VRNFRSDLSITGESVQTIPALIAAMESLPRDPARIAARRAALAETTSAHRAALAAAAGPLGDRLTKAMVSRVLGEALDAEARPNAVFSELGTMLGTLPRRAHRSWFQEPHSGGLGWSFPAALGAQLAEPDRLCVATMGDGSYLFSNPVACHQIAEALQLPVLVVILNNGEWGAVRQSVAGLYPKGEAVRANAMPLTGLTPSPDFCKVAEASRAFAREVRDPDELRPALDAALRVTREERRCALLNVLIA
jgi:acetolactate synthase-1/2/3 large subunit